MRLRHLPVESLESRRLLAAGYQIELVFEASVAANVQSIIQTAANRWTQIITGDVPDVGAGAWGSAVDDIRITARVKSIDGAGSGVAQARPTYIRSGSSKLPIAGEIEIDSADIASQTAAGTLQNIVTHEIAHALGYGTLWSQFPGLTSGLGGSNPLFLGFNALNEYRLLTNNWTATGVPLENTGGAGTRDAHWRESVFGTELLTGFVNAGSSPISRVSLGQFADLGYQVNYAAADFFSLGGTSTGATISGSVFNDANKNGTRDGGEAGVGGRTVYLDANYNGFLDGAEKSTTTDGSGNYSFTSVTAGTYAIRQVVPAGSTQTSPAGNNAWWLTVSNGQTASGYAFGVATNSVATTGSLSGRVFNDANRNGTQDAGESGLNGRTVYVDLNYNGSRESNEPAVTTDASGNYTISNLAASNAYAVRQVLPAGETQTTPAGNNAWWVALGAGQAIGSLNFGAAGSGSGGGGSTLSGKVFTDNNRNGSQDAGEPGRASATVYLDANYNGSLDAGERSTATDASGNWSLGSLTAGVYAVRVVSTGLTQTYPFSNQSHWVQLNANATVGGLNFGLAGSSGGGSSVIGGSVFRDVNWNGQKDASEAGQAGRTVYLDANYNGQLDAGEVTTTTDASGNYRFNNLAAGTYAVRAIGLSGWYQTKPSSNGSWWLTVNASTNRTDLDFGFGF